MSQIRRPYSPEVAVPPGETLRETLEALGMSEAELARRTGLELETVRRIVEGSAAVTPAAADRLEVALGVPATFWIAMERNYRHRRRRLRAARLDRPSRTAR